MSAQVPRFSIVVLARNEALTLPRLLSGLGRFMERGGEVLVADTGSTDETVAVAREHGCRVVSLGDAFDSTLSREQAAEIERRFGKAEEGPLVSPGERLFHFGSARQQAGMLATHPFVLQLDASDQVLAFDIDAFDRWINGGESGGFEYEQRYGNVVLRIGRFYDRNRYAWEGRVHEVLAATSPSPPRIRCDPTQLLVRHHKDENKTRNYLAGLGLQVLEHPEKPRWRHYLGRELFYHHRYESAISVLGEHAAMADAWVAERSQSLCFVGECHEALGRMTDAEEAYRRAHALDATRREPVLRLAASYCRRGKFEPAVHYASESLTIPRTCAYAEPEANYSWLPHSILYWSLFWMGRKEEARRHWNLYKSLAPEDVIAREHARLFPEQPSGIS